MMSRRRRLLGALAALANVLPDLERELKAA